MPEAADGGLEAAQFVFFLVGQGRQAALFLLLVQGGFALQQPVLLVTEQAAVLFSGGGLEAVVVLSLAQTGGHASSSLVYRLLQT